MVCDQLEIEHVGNTSTDNLTGALAFIQGCDMENCTKLRDRFNYMLRLSPNVNWKELYLLHRNLFEEFGIEAPHINSIS